MSLAASLLLAMVATHAVQTPQALVPGEPLTLQAERGADGALLCEKTFRFTTTRECEVHLWATSREVKPWAKIDQLDGGAHAVFEDPNPWETLAIVILPVEPNRELELRVGTRDPRGLEGLRVGLWTQSLVSRANAERIKAARKDLDLAKQANAAGQHELARTRIAGCLEVARALLAEGEGSLAERASGHVLNLFHLVGYCAYELRDISAARDAWGEMARVQSEILPPEHPKRITGMQNHALALKELGDVAQAITLEEHVLHARETGLSPRSPSLQQARLNLAVSYDLVGRLERSKELLEQALAVRSVDLDSEDEILLKTEVNLASTLTRLGEVPRARTLLERAIEVFDRTLPREHAFQRAARTNLAGVCKRLGDRARARELHEEVLAVDLATLAADHPDIQSSRLNLADLLDPRTDSERILELVRAAEASLSRSLPENHPRLLSAEAQLAQRELDHGDVARARELARSLLERAPKALSAGHPTVISARGVLAAILEHEGDLEGTLAALRESNELERTRDGKERALRPNRELDVARLELLLGRPERAAELLQSAARTLLEESRTSALACPAREAEERAAARAVQVSRFLDLTRPDGKLGANVRLRELALELTESVRSAGATPVVLRTDPALAGLRERVSAASRRLAAIARTTSKAESFADARDEKERLERELLAALEGAGSAAPAFDTGRLQATLAPEEALVSFWTYRHERAAETHELCMLAFVVRAGAPLARVELGPLAPIEEAADSWRAALSRGDALAAPSRGQAAGSEARGGALEAGAELRRLVLDPLVPLLAGARRLFLAPDGVLHLVPLDVLPDGEGVLGDRLRVRCCLALGERLAAQAPGCPDCALVLAGGIDYGAAPAGDPGQAFAPLPATADEVRAVGEGFRAWSGAGAKVVALEGSSADFESLARAAPSARFLHLAVHGWFSPVWQAVASDAPRTQAWSLELGAALERTSPMLLCGLALSNANAAPGLSGRSSGRVTAEELASLDLSHCELAVLSACETSLGVLRAGQGVASLQKAFRQAGARAVISSLWAVPDRATEELFREFYRQLWIAGSAADEALWRAKSRMRTALDEAGRPRFAPRDWAAWVLTADPR